MERLVSPWDMEETFQCVLHMMLRLLQHSRCDSGGVAEEGACCFQCREGKAPKLAQPLAPAGRSVEELWLGDDLAVLS